MMSTARRQGFMLLDMALALSLLLLLFAVIWPSMGRGTSKAKQAATALSIANLLRADRSAAALEGSARGTRIDLAHRVITSAAGRTIAVPEDLSMELFAGSSCTRGDRLFVISFAPDGSSCGASLFLRKQNSLYVIRVNWLSGMIDVADSAKG
jgi:general secretion pathway protein H